MATSLKIQAQILTVEARISCGQHPRRKLLHTLESVNFTLYRLFSPRAVEGSHKTKALVNVPNIVTPQRVQRWEKRTGSMHAPSNSHVLKGHQKLREGPEGPMGGNGRGDGAK